MGVIGTTTAAASSTQHNWVVLWGETKASTAKLEAAEAATTQHSIMSQATAAAAAAAAREAECNKTQL